MEIFKNGHMTRVAQKLDEILAEQSQYWEASKREYGHKDQDVPGRAYVVHYLPPNLVQLDTVDEATADMASLQRREVA